jgi:O-antigen/teichoic acid export membrane protein
MQIATFITTFGDRYFLNRAGDTAVVGLYGLAYTFGFLLVNFGFLPFQTVWDPQRFAIAKRADRDAIFARAFIYLNLGLLSAALGLSLFAGDVLRVIAAPAFHSAAAFVPVIVAAYVFQCWGNFLNTGIYLTEKTEYFTAANWVAAVVAIVGYLTLIPRWLGWGAALASLASLGVRFWLAYTFSQRLWPIRYQWGPVVRLALLALAGAAVSFLAPPMWLPLSILSHVALFVAYAALVWRLPILTDGDRAAVRRILRQPRQFAAGRAS